MNVAAFMCSILWFYQSCLKSFVISPVRFVTRHIETHFGSSVSYAKFRHFPLVPIRLIINKLTLFPFFSSYLTGHWIFSQSTSDVCPSLSSEDGGGPCSLYVLC